jgi:hypothetical protein
MSKTKAFNMGKSKKNGRKATSKKLGKRVSKAKVKATAGISAKLRHMRDRRGNLHVWNAQPLPTHLIAKPTVAQPKSKHRSYFEFVENSNKRKKLEFQVEAQAGRAPLGNTLSPIDRSLRTEDRHPVTNLFLLGTLSLLQHAKSFQERKTR